MTWSLQFESCDSRRYVHDQFPCTLSVKNDAEGGGVVWEATLRHGMEMSESQCAANETHALSAADAWVRYQSRPS